MEPTEKRKCLVCKKVKVTTVRRTEESIFVCEQCLRGKVRTEYLEKMSGSDRVTLASILLLAIFVVGFLIGKYLL